MTNRLRGALPGAVTLGLLLFGLLLPAFPAFAQQRSARDRFVGGAYDGSAGSVRPYAWGSGSLAAFVLSGDHILYRGVDFGGGTRTFRANVSSETAGGVIEVRLGGPDGRLVGSLRVPGTQSWDRYVTLDTPLTEAVTGRHDLVLRFTGGEGYLLNLEWFDFPGEGAAAAASSSEERRIGGGFDAAAGTVRPYAWGSGSMAAFISSGDHAVYRGVRFGKGASTFRASVASATAGGTVEIRLDGPDGPLAGTLAVPNTGSWEQFVTLEAPVSGLSGSRDVVLRFVGGEGYLLNLEWFEFTGGEPVKAVPAPQAAAPPAEPTPASAPPATVPPPAQQPPAAAPPPAATPSPTGEGRPSPAPHPLAPEGAVSAPLTELQRANRFEMTFRVRSTLLKRLNGKDYEEPGTNLDLGSPRPFPITWSGRNFTGEWRATGLGGFDNVATVRGTVSPDGSVLEFVTVTWEQSRAGGYQRLLWGQVGGIPIRPADVPGDFVAGQGNLLASDRATYLKGLDWAEYPGGGNSTTFLRVEEVSTVTFGFRVERD